MRPHPPTAIVLALFLGSISFGADRLEAADQVVTLGDSLTFAYEAEFGFQYTVPFTSLSFGDGFPSKVRNWVEILNDPAYRGDHFDLGARDTYTVGGFPFPEEQFLFRHRFNWAIPGQTVSQMRSFVEGSANFLEILRQIPEFAGLDQFLGFTDFDLSQFALTDFEQQVRNEAERLVFFIGGNDVRGIYGTVYGGGSAGSFVEDFIEDSLAILDRVETLNPDLPVVIVNVPHIGITPEIKGKHPPDDLRTGRVTVVLDELNARLAAIATERGYGYADIYTRTLPLLGDAPLCIQGLPFANASTPNGDLSRVWLNGQFSANFHPNTNAHVVIANEVIHAFNRAYDAGIAPLTVEETGVLLERGADIDMTFETWMNCFGLSGLPRDDDSDLDGLDAYVEFALGLDPTRRDADRLEFSIIDDEGGQSLELAYPIRLPTSQRIDLSPVSGPDLENLTSFENTPTRGPDGLARARLPITPGQRGFLSLRAAP